MKDQHFRSYLKMKVFHIVQRLMSSYRTHLFPTSARGGRRLTLPLFISRPCWLTASRAACHSFGNLSATQSLMRRTFSGHSKFYFTHTKTILRSRKKSTQTVTIWLSYRKQNCGFSNGSLQKVSPTFALSTSEVENGFQCLTMKRTKPKKTYSKFDAKSLSKLIKRSLENLMLRRKNQRFDKLLRFWYNIHVANPVCGVNGVLSWRNVDEIFSKASSCRRCSFLVLSRDEQILFKTSSVSDWTSVALCFSVLVLLEESDTRKKAVQKY